MDRHGNAIKAVAGYDATLSAPKSLSVLWGLTGDDGFAECHDVAVNAVVAMIERYGSTTRIRSNGSRLHPETQGLTVGVFRQSTSCADDPQLHTHVVVGPVSAIGGGHKLGDIDPQRQPDLGQDRSRRARTSSESMLWTPSQADRTIPCTARWTARSRARHDRPVPTDPNRHRAFGP